MEHPNERSQQEHIASIFKEYTTPSRVLRSFTNLSNTVIHTALSGQSKFVFEILQNADDAFEYQQQSIEVKFILQDNYLVVHHNGKGFDYNDVERICDYASQIEEVKANDLSKTGYKGLGFKSLFNLSDCIYVHSNGYSFRFDKTYWPDPENKPWQVIPIWCRYDELPLCQKYPYDQPVNFILRVNTVSQLESQLRELVDQPELLLYLHRIDKLSVNFDEETHFLERRTEKSGVFNRVDFYKNQQVHSTWLSRTYRRSVQSDVQKSIRGASRFIYPDKIKNAKEVIFTFALRSDKALKEISKVRGLCYSTLPTQLHLTLPYHINSLFILNLDRTQLHENEWNEFLMYQIGCLQFSLLKDLAEVDYLKNYVIELFVRGINHPYGKFTKAFLKGFTKARVEVGWLPAHQGPHLLKLGEVWTDQIEFFKQNFENIRDYKIHPYIINYEVRGQHYLFQSEAEAKHFTYDQLFRDFPTNYYPQLTRNGYVNYIYYLYERLKDLPAYAKPMTKLRNAQFLRAKDGTLLSSRNALLEEYENPIPNFTMLNPIDNEYLPSSNIDSIKDWLTRLDARRLTTPIQVLRESILKWIDSGEFDLRINARNHVGIINYLAKGLDHFSNKESEKLKQRLLILTESNEFKLANSCYLHDVVSIKELSNIISNDEKISSAYDRKNLRGFFIHVGVRNKINPIDELRKGMLTWIKNGDLNDKVTTSNYKPIIDNIALHYPTFERNLTDSEKTELKNMPVLTCAQTFHKAQFCYFDSAVPNVKGLDVVIAKDKLVSTYNISPTVQKFLAKVGVSKNITPMDVMRKSILKWIHEREINRKITRDNHHDILKYMGEQWINLSNSSGLKPKEKKDLKIMPILTEGGVFRAANNCYWSVSNDDGNYSEEIPGIKSVISPDEFVSSDYQSREIIRLLEELGVRAIRFTDIYEKYSNHLKHPENIKWFFSQLVNYWKRKTAAKTDQLLNCLQQKLRAASCLLAKNGKLYSSTELYSSRFGNIEYIDRNAILLLKCEKLPEDLETYLGFRTELDFKCIKQLLKAINKNTNIGKEETKIFFTTLLEQLRLKNRYEVIKNQLSLLSEDNKLLSAKELYYFIEKDASCSLKSCYLKRIYGMSHEETLELADLCGVNTLPFKLEIEPENETYDSTLEEFYLERLAFIVVEESKKLNEDFKVTLKRLYSDICAIELYQCQNIHVKYPFGDSTKILYHFQDLMLYVVGKWFKRRPKIFEYLTKTLHLEADIDSILYMNSPISQCDREEWLSDQNVDPRKLNIVEEELKQLISDKDKLDLLTPVESAKNEQPEDSEYESDQLEDDLLDNTEVITSDESSSDESSVDMEDSYLPKQPEVTERGRTICDTVTDLQSGATAVSVKGKDIIEADIRWITLNELEIDRKKRMQPGITISRYSSTESLPIESQEIIEIPDMKWISEKYVFTFLQDRYKIKYPNSRFVLSDGIFTLLSGSQKIEIVWLNASGEKGESYDLLLKKQGEVKRLIEIISTNDVENNDSFNITHQTFVRKISQLAEELLDHKEKFCIFRVFHTNNSSSLSVKELKSSASLYKVVPLQNP